LRPESASRRRAGAALWRAAKAEGLAHPKTLRAIRESESESQSSESRKYWLDG